jgi:type I restriction enzyme R subunit
MDRAHAPRRAAAAQEPELLRVHRDAQAQDAAVFGRVGVGRRPAPFHLYSMRQAIEEGFILDVLRNYTTYKPTTGS